ncbi:hypothetical protein [Streptomyces sp. GQFP]|uniref:hypothetical protein n=1 Tax=Streptomyces sp. GQFP TaxID=2907545 RepID=UPI001F2CBBAA|nr:hypothetical protein [Streptomyces sp. GQFP]UIX33601.1 hypothetical protein LUX31_28345 [Streptomyces sp. GQFP]
MAGPTRTAAVPPRTVLTLLTLVTLITLVACAAGCSKPSASPAGGDPAAATFRASPVTYEVPADLTPAVLPATGAESRWSQGLDAFGEAVADGEIRDCVRSRGEEMPDLAPLAFTRYMDLPDLEFIRRHGFGSTAVPVPSPDPAASQDSPGPELMRRCLAAGQTVLNEFRALYGPLRMSWFKVIGRLGSDESVALAYRAFPSCLAQRGVRVKSESRFFGLVDQRLAAGGTDMGLAADYATCMAPVEAAREPLREELRTRFVTDHRQEIKELTEKLMPRVRKLAARYKVRLCFPALEQAGADVTETAR